MHDEQEPITLTQATKIAPGRPSTNCMWRWCRRGIRARSGRQVKLEHMRVGGKIFTTARWVREFGQRLAAADAEYFDARNEAGAVSHPRPAQKASEWPKRRAVAPVASNVEKELEEAGL